MFRNRHDGTFARITSGSPAHDGGRACGAAWGDYDNDGFLDLYVACGDGVAQPNLLYRNNGNGNHWLKVHLRGTTSNRDGIGAAVRVRATIGDKVVQQLRQIFANSGVRDISSPLAHFGLGNATKATTVRVEWPSGTVQELTNVPVDQFLTITEPAILKLAATRVADGLRIQCRGEPNTTYTLQSSSDMAVWNQEHSVTADATGLATTTVTMGTGPQFFRVVKE